MKLTCYKLRLDREFTVQNSGYHVIKNCVFVDSGQSLRLTDNSIFGVSTQASIFFFLTGHFRQLSLRKSPTRLAIKKVIVHP